MAVLDTSKIKCEFVNTLHNLSSEKLCTRSAKRKYSCGNWNTGTLVCTGLLAYTICRSSDPSYQIFFTV